MCSVYFTSQTGQIIFWGKRNRCKSIRVWPDHTKKDRILEYELTKIFNLVCHGRDKNYLVLFLPYISNSGNTISVEKKLQNTQQNAPSPAHPVDLKTYYKHVSKAFKVEGLKTQALLKSIGSSQ